MSKRTCRFHYVAFPSSLPAPVQNGALAVSLVTHHLLLCMHMRCWDPFEADGGRDARGSIRQVCQRCTTVLRPGERQCTVACDGRQ
jgi:hypothetical protein